MEFSLVSCSPGNSGFHPSLEPPVAASWKQLPHPRALHFLRQGWCRPPNWGERMMTTTAQKGSGCGAHTLRCSCVFNGRAGQGGFMFSFPDMIKEFF